MKTWAAKIEDATYKAKESPRKLEKGGPFCPATARDQPPKAAQVRRLQEAMTDTSCERSCRGEIHARKRELRQQ